MTIAPTETELESKEIANHLVYILKKMEQDVPDWVEDAARCSFGDMNQIEVMNMILIDLCISLSAVDRAAIFNDKDDPRSRALLIWWVIYTASH